MATLMTKQANTFWAENKLISDSLVLIAERWPPGNNLISKIYNILYRSIDFHFSFFSLPSRKALGLVRHSSSFSCSRHRSYNFRILLGRAFPFCVLMLLCSFIYIYTEIPSRPALSIPCPYYKCVCVCVRTYFRVETICSFSCLFCHTSLNWAEVW